MPEGMKSGTAGLFFAVMPSDTVEGFLGNRDVDGHILCRCLRSASGGGGY